MEPLPWVPEVIFSSGDNGGEQKCKVCLYPHPKNITSGIPGMETLKTIS